MANCANSRINKTPITDGVKLYPNDSNDPPADHLALGIDVAREIVKRSITGAPDLTGKLVLASMGGMSNAKQEFAAFMAAYRAKYGLGRRITFFNGNRGSWDAKRIAVDDPVGYWTWYLDTLASKNISPLQVQVAWIKNSVRLQSKPYPEDAGELRLYIQIILDKAKTLFPNLQQVYVSSAIYSGYSTSPARTEPHAYNEGMGIRALVESHLGEINPWVAWSIYPWADGSLARSDGLRWLCPVDFKSDGVHPSAIGAAKVADMLLKFFETYPAASWFNA